MKALLFAVLVAAPLLGQCTYQVSPPGTTVPAGSATSTVTGTITVKATGPVGAICRWTAAANDSWLKIVFGQTGSGDGSVGWSADRNVTPAPRTGTLTVAGQTITITQTGANCDFTLLPNTASASYPVSGGSSFFQVKTGCAWQALSNSPWITTTSTGTNDGIINYTVVPNPCVSERRGFITVGTQQFTVDQAGSPDNLKLSSTVSTFPPEGGSGSVTVSTGAACPWSAQAGVAWIQLVARSGTGNGSITYRVAVNTGSERNGAITVGSQSWTIAQNGAAALPMLLNAVVNSANYGNPPVAPGEIVVLFGQQFGPEGVVEAQVAAGGRGFTKILADTRVLFDGIPAPMIYAAPNQVSAVVPYGVAGQTSTRVVVEYKGVASPTLTIPVRAAAPAIFTLDKTGTGPGAIRNQDYSINGVGNAALRGSVIQIYCTGGGVTLPASIDGQFTGEPLPYLTLPVSVTIGGVAAKLWYAGGAPQTVAGLTQINAEVPAGVIPGNNVPVKIRIGDWDSQDGVTVAIQ
jgi:uncharacterized protein (TIGR03437 family)